MWMSFTRQQLRGAFSHSFRYFRSDETAMVQEKRLGAKPGVFKLHLHDKISHQLTMT